MPKVKYPFPIDHVSGRISKSSNVLCRHFRKSNKNFAMIRDENYQYTRTTKQRAMRDDFGARSRAATRWLHANRNPPTAEYLALRREFESQMKYDNFFTYLISRLPNP